MKSYKEKKEEIRSKAIEWQYLASEKIYSMNELAHYCEYFYKLAQRYGLIKEFKANGII